MRIVYLIVFLITACRPSNQIGELVGAINERPLEGTKWLLVELNGKDISSVETAKPIFIFYEKEGSKINGFAGCNSFTGTYTADGSTISVIVASTRMFCEGKMEVETEFLTALNTPYKYKLEGSHLLLRDKNVVVAKFLADVKTSK